MAVHDGVHILLSDKAIIKIVPGSPQYRQILDAFVSSDYTSWCKNDNEIALIASATMGHGKN